MSKEKPDLEEDGRASFSLMAALRPETERKETLTELETVLTELETERKETLTRLEETVRAKIYELAFSLGSLRSTFPLSPRTEKTETFGTVVDRLGKLAGTVDQLVEDNALMLGKIEAEGDRIDRLNADNRATLESLESFG